MPCFFGGSFKEKKTHFYLLCQQTIAEVDPTFLRWGCTEAKNRNRKQELTGKEVAKKIAKESGTALGKEAKRMIPVSPHGEFAPNEFAPTIKALFRVRPKILYSYFRCCYRVIKRFLKTISVYVCLISLDDDC